MICTNCWSDDPLQSQGECYTLTRTLALADNNFILITRCRLKTLSYSERQQTSGNILTAASSVWTVYM